MELSIINQTQQPLMKRTKVECTISFTEKITPSRASLQEKIAAKCKSKPQLVVVKPLKNEFGVAKASFDAFVYEDEASLKSYEQPYVQKRNEWVEPKAQEQTEEGK